MENTMKISAVVWVMIIFLHVARFPGIVKIYRMLRTKNILGLYALINVPFIAINIFTITNILGKDDINNENYILHTLFFALSIIISLSIMFISPFLESTEE